MYSAVPFFVFGWYQSVGLFHVDNSNCCCCTVLEAWPNLLPAVDWNSPRRHSVPGAQ